MIEMGYDTIDIERLRSSLDPKTRQEEAGASDFSFTFKIGTDGSVTQVPN